jgi:hypothetical protein
VEGTSELSAETITIRPDAKTGKQSWPCRELNLKPTPNGPNKHSRFGEKSGLSQRKQNGVIPASFRVS